MSRLSRGVALSLAIPIALAGCVATPPTGPSVMALPASGKPLERFQQEDASCRSYASAQIGNADTAEVANKSAVSSAALGTLLAAVAGTLFGAAAGNPGAGAAIGGGTGLLFGSASGASAAGASAAGLQQRYDMAYVQCMAANGNRVPTVVQSYPGYPYATYPYAYPYRYPYYGYYGY